MVENYARAGRAFCPTLLRCAILAERCQPLNPNLTAVAAFNFSKAFARWLN
jgi:hypothetical protein